MKKRPWIILPLAAALALAVGAVAVQAAPTSPSGGARNYAQVFIDKLAGILHLTPTKTQSALTQAELQVIDQMVKDGRLTQAQANALKSRIQSGQGFALGPGFGPGFGFRNRGFGPGSSVLQSLRTAELGAAAKALGLSPPDLTSQLQSGKSLSQLAQQKGVSNATLQADIRSAAKSALDQAVKAGTITQQQEDALLARGLGRLGPNRGALLPSYQAPPSGPLE